MVLSVCDCIILALLRYLVSNCYVLLLPKQCNALGAFIVQPMHWNSGSLTHKVFPRGCSTRLAVAVTILSSEDPCGEPHVNSSTPKGGEWSLTRMLP